MRRLLLFIDPDIMLRGAGEDRYRGIEKACDYDWFNQTLCRVNDSLVAWAYLRASFTGTGPGDFYVWRDG